MCLSNLKVFILSINPISFYLEKMEEADMKAKLKQKKWKFKGVDFELTKISNLNFAEFTGIVKIDLNYEVLEKLRQSSFELNKPKSQVKIRICLTRIIVFHELFIK